MMWWVSGYLMGWRDGVDMMVKSFAVGDLVPEVNLFIFARCRCAGLRERLTGMRSGLC